jgi:hypothetical protein
LRRQEERGASDRSHYETELTLLKNAIAVPTVSLVREPDPHHCNGQVFALVNKSNAEATSIMVCDLVIPIPPRVQKQWHEMREQFRIPNLETPTLEEMPNEWIVHFRPVKDLGRDDKATLEYTTENGGPLMTIENYLADADSLIHDYYIATCRIIIEYSNSDHSRRWRRTYEFHYVITGRRDWLESKGIVEITDSTSHQEAAP